MGHGHHGRRTQPLAAAAELAARDHHEVGCVLLGTRDGHAIERVGVHGVTAAARVLPKDERLSDYHCDCHK